MDRSATVPAFKDIELWIGGIDPAGNLCLAVQKSAPGQSRFQGGFRDIINSAGVWKVTKLQMKELGIDVTEPIGKQSDIAASELSTLPPRLGE